MKLVLKCLISVCQICDSRALKTSVITDWRFLISQLMFHSYVFVIVDFSTFSLPVSLLLQRAIMDITSNRGAENGSPLFIFELSFKTPSITFYQKL